MRLSVEKKVLDIKETLWYNTVKLNRVCWSKDCDRDETISQRAAKRLAERQWVIAGSE